MHSQETDLRRRNNLKNSSDSLPKNTNKKSEEIEKPISEIKIEIKLVTAFFVTGILVFTLCCFFKQDDFTTLARQDIFQKNTGEVVNCSFDYLKDVAKYPKGCKPSHCGRYVSDDIVTPEETEIILKLVKKITELVHSSALLDLHSGGLSDNGDMFNIYSGENPTVLTQEELDVYKNIWSKIRHRIAKNFGIDENLLYLTSPCFIAKITSQKAKYFLDQYWRIHVDKLSYPRFHFTSLLYLADYGKDFTGGRFIFVDNPKGPKFNVSVEPRKGRVLFFTSGEENTHYIEKVTEGTRIAWTIPFSFNEKVEIGNPNNKKNSLPKFED